MSRDLFYVAAIVGGIVLSALCAPAQAEWFTDQMDALWLDTNPVPRANCLQFLVKAWPQRLYRGRTSPHDCLVNAIRDYRNGDHEEAMGWIQAAFCPDREAQQGLMRKAPDVLGYVLTQYGPFTQEGLSSERSR